MIALTIKKIKELDEKNIPIPDVRLVHLLEDDNREEIARTAQKFEVTTDELCSYFWLQICVEQRGIDFDDIPEIEDVASQLGIDFNSFHAYLCHRVGKAYPTEEDRVTFPLLDDGDPVEKPYDWNYDDDDSLDDQTESLYDDVGVRPQRRDSTEKPFESAYYEESTTDSPKNPR